MIIDGSEPEGLLGWVSQVLDKMTLGHCLQGHECDLECGTSSPQPEMNSQFAEASSKVAMHLRPLLITAYNTMFN